MSKPKTITLPAPAHPPPPMEPVTLTAPGGDSVAVHVPAEPAYTIPELVVRWEDGSCGDALNDAKAILKDAVEESGRRVLGWEISGAEMDLESGDPETPGFTRRLMGYEEGNLNKPQVVQVRHLKRTVKPRVDLEARTEEKWVRLTTPSGSCAVEVLTTSGGKVLERKKYHPEDMRHIAEKYALKALQEYGG